MNSYRFVICVDLDAPDVDAAYKRLYKTMGEVERRSAGDVQWESTDENYCEGEEISPDAMQKSRMATLSKEADHV